MAEARIVLTSLADEQQASDFAAALVERRLAACVNIVGPVRSIYRWQGKLERENEFLLIIKTTSEQAARLEAAFNEMHPYELPELVELSVEGGSEAYLSWISGEVQEP